MDTVQDEGPPEMSGLAADFGRMLLATATIALVGLVIGRSTWLEIGTWDPSGAVDAWWRKVWGLGSWPVALALAAAGAALLGQRVLDPLQLPWRRVIAFELAILAALGLAHGIEPAQGGLVGESLAEAVRIVLGAAFVRPAFIAALVLALWLATGATLPSAWTQALESLLREASPPGHRHQAHPGDRDRAAAQPQRPPSPPLSAAREAAGSPSAAHSAAPARPRGAARPRGTRAELRDRRMGERGPAASGPTEPALHGPASARATTVGKRRLPVIRGLQGQGRRPLPASGKLRRGNAAALPPLDLFALDEDTPTIDSQGLRQQAERIEQCLAGFGIPVEVVEIEPGPNVTRFALRPGTVMRAGQPMRVRLSRITAHRHDLTLALAAEGLRIEAPIPGRSLVGIEVPNRRAERVAIRSLLEDTAFQALRQAGSLPLVIGRRTGGEALVAKLTTMPHLLIAGATGSGKSVFMNSLLVSLISQQTPDQVRLILIDPKRVELGRYASLPHLVAPPITDPAEAVAALRWAVAEMEERYRRLEDRGVRDRAGFNRLSPAGEPPMPALVLIIDELADLMMTASEAVEPMLTRLAQMGRATGVHLVVATQRPSVDVLTGLIKANFPSRVAFAVASAIDSRVILDQTGAETLQGSGDLLYQPPDQAHPIRAQGAWVGDDELDRLLRFWVNGHWPPPEGPAPWADLVNADPDAALYVAAQEIALANPHHSASLLQRRLRIGYAKAKALHDRLLADGFD